MCKSFCCGEELCFRGQFLAPQPLSFLSVVGALSFQVAHIQKNLVGRGCGMAEKGPILMAPIPPLEDYIFLMSP